MEGHYSHRRPLGYGQGLTHLGLFKPSADAGTLLSRGIGWLSWDQLKEILKIAKGQFRTEAERKFVDDLIGCL